MNWCALGHRGYIAGYKIIHCTIPQLMAMPMVFGIICGEVGLSAREMQIRLRQSIMQQSKCITFLLQYDVFVLC